MNILGLNAYHGDVSAALVRDGQLVAAVEEERYRRIKHVAGFPGAGDARLPRRWAASTAADVDVFAVSRDPRAHLLAQGAGSCCAIARRARSHRARRNLVSLRALPATIAAALGLDESRVRVAAAVCRASSGAPGERRVRLAVRRGGDLRDRRLRRLRQHVVGTCWPDRGSSVDGRVFFPHSLGLLYLAITQYLGFPNYGDEFKVMGLAPYGEPRYTREIESLVHLRDDGGFELDSVVLPPLDRRRADDVGRRRAEARARCSRRSSRRCSGRRGGATSRSARSTRRSPRRCRSRYERAAMHVLRHVQQATGSTRLCLAGGCAMNSVANGKIREQTGFRDVFIQPASGDNGTALGAAFYAWNQIAGAAARLRDGARLLGTVVRATRRSSRRSTPSRPRSPSVAAADAPGPTRRRSTPGPRRRLPPAASSAGFRDGWSGARARSATAASSPIRGAPTCATSSTPGSSSASGSGRSRRRSLEEALDDYFVGAVPDPFMLQVYPVRPDKRAVVPGDHARRRIGPPADGEPRGRTRATIA